MVGRTEFQIEKTRPSGWVRISVKGDLDLSSAEQFRLRMRALESADTNVSVDLSQLDFIDSAGAHALLDAIADSRQSTWCVQVEPTMAEQARRLFHLLKATGLPVDL